MNRKIRFLIALALVAGILGYKHLHKPQAARGVASGEVAVDVVRRYGSLEFKPCSLSPDFGTQSLQAQCGSLEVPENHAAPDGRKIRLAIAWIPAKGEAEPDPMFMLAGGPGQSALESFPGIAPAFAEMGKRRHVILVDQRGTGASNKLICKDSEGKSAVLDEGAESIQDAQAFASRCAAQLGKTADPRFYSTSDAIQDLDAVRAALGAERINLMGISYGSRVAQQYAKRYPPRTRTLTIDGIVPNSLVLGNMHAKNLERSLDLQFARCAQDKSCRTNVGNPRERLNALMTKLQTDPPLVRYRDATTGESKEEVMRPTDVGMLARMFAYSPAAASVLPLQLREATEGRYEPLMALSKLLSGTLGEQIMHGMQLSVICAEDAGELKSDPADAGSLIGVGIIEVLKAQCDVWPHGTRPAGFREPLRGAVPVLILSGEFDPVTPPRYGDAVLYGLADPEAAVPKDAKPVLQNARHLVVRGQGHNVLPIGCMPKLFARFVETADAKALDAHCLDTVPYTPAFTGFYGWEP